jgi:hypothetical protein
VFGIWMPAVEDSGCETIMATVRKIPRPKAAVAIPLNMFDSNPAVSVDVERTLRDHAGTGAEQIIHLLFRFEAPVGWR